MFVLRSAFWLTLAFLVIAPHGTDFGATATQLRDDALAIGIEAGSQVIVGQIADNISLPTLDFVTAAPAQAPEPRPLGPTAFPHPRPAALG